VSEKAKIQEKSITLLTNHSGGADTSDRIFLLSIEEVVRYFGDSGVRPALWLNL
jgi:hypothetical protein